MNFVELGRRAEQQASDYLQELGYFILARNFKFKQMGELDIVARQNDTLVFVEVKYRTSRKFGLPEEAITIFKQVKMRRLAQAWMQRHRYHGHPIRFDVIAVELRNGTNEMRHYMNAF